MSYFVTEPGHCQPCKIIRKYDFKSAVRVRLLGGEEVVTTPDHLRDKSFAQERKETEEAAYRTELCKFAETVATYKRPIDWKTLADQYATSKIGIISKYLAAQRRGLISEWDPI
jgi:hypothetical protein